MWKRARFHRMGAEDWLATLGALVAIGVTTGMLHVVLPHVLPGFSSNPPFLEMQPLAPGDGWVLAAWLPMFFFNIFGEELLWHGYLLPRNEVRFGRTAWLVNSAGFNAAATRGSGSSFMPG
jgi:membrane protease YdiL (CAAX protease family)